VPSLPIVEHLDIFKNGTQGILMTFIAFMINQLGFHNTEKRLGYGIIPAISLSGHALHKTMLTELFSEIRARILNAAILGE